MLASSTLSSLTRACAIDREATCDDADERLRVATSVFHHAELEYHRSWDADGWKYAFVSVHRFRALGGVPASPVWVVLEHAPDGTFGPCSEAMCTDPRAKPYWLPLLRRAWVTDSCDDALRYARSRV